MAHYLFHQRWREVERLKDENPAEAVELLEVIVKAGPEKELQDQAKTLLKELRQKQLGITRAIDCAGRAMVDGDPEEALKAWRNVLSLAPLHPLAAKNVLDIETLLREFQERQSQAALLMDQAEFEPAMQCLKQCLTLIPASDAVRLTLGSCQSRADAYTLAMQRARSTRAAKQLVSSTMHVQAALSDACQSSEALELCSSLDKAIQESRALLEVSKQEMRRGRFAEAESAIRKIEESVVDLEGVDSLKTELSKAKEAFTRFMNAGEYAKQQRDLAGAAKNAEQALEVCPDSIPAAGFLQSVRGDQAKALQQVSAGKKAIRAAAFADASQRLESARQSWPLMTELNEAEVDIKAIQSAYELHLTTARGALAKGDFTNALEACKKTLNRCPKSDEAEQLRHQVAVADASDWLERKKRDERAKQRRARIKAFVLKGIKRLMILLPLAGVAAVLATQRAWILGAARPWLVDHCGALALAWALVLCLTGAIHKTRYTNLFRHVYSGLFGRRVGAERLAMAVVTLILAVVCGAAAYGVFWLCNQSMNMSARDSMAMAIGCGLAFQAVAFIRSIVSRCKWHRV